MHNHFITVSVPGSARGTGRDPNNTIVVPPDPKPHVWTLAWNGIKHVARRAWEGVSTYQHHYICMHV